MHCIYTRTPPSEQKHDIPGHDYDDGWMDITMNKIVILVSRQSRTTKSSRMGIFASFLILRVSQLNLTMLNAYVYYT